MNSGEFETFWVFLQILCFLPFLCLLLQCLSTMVCLLVLVVLLVLLLPTLFQGQKTNREGTFSFPERGAGL